MPRFERGVPELDFGNYRIIEWLQQQIGRAQKLSDQITIAYASRRHVATTAIQF